MTTPSILINFPTNIGDTILSLPVLDRVKVNYPKSKITVIASPNTKELLSRNNFIDEVIVFNKFADWKEKIKFVFSLRGKYNIIVDLKNSFLPSLLGIKKRTPFYRKFPSNIHQKDRYLSLIKPLLNPLFVPPLIKGGFAVRSQFVLTEDEINRWNNFKLTSSVFIASSSRSSLKRYPYKYLKEVIIGLSKKYPLVVLGEEKDREFYGDILNLEGIVDLAGKTKIIDIFYLLEHYASSILCVDSAALHIASYLNIPIVTLFGPTDTVKYGPWSENYKILKNQNLACSPCEKAACQFNYQCMNINPDEVVKAVEGIISKILQNKS